MLGGHFYHQTIRRAVSVFGTLFNDINIVRRDSAGNVLNIIKVPLAYGPRQKFLARIEEQALLDDPKVAIKLPRMSFEITSMAYDPNTKLVKGNKQTFSNQTTEKVTTAVGPVGYRMGIQLNIIAKNQDDALQVLEQIIPHFQPQYTVTVRQVDDEFKSDMPFILQGVTLADDYEGDYATRRALIYTLDFETRVRFYGEVVSAGTIQKTAANFFNNNDPKDVKFLERQDVVIDNGSADGTAVSYTGIVPDSITLTLSSVAGFAVGQNVIGTTSGSSGVTTLVDGNDVTVTLVDGLFDVGETLTVQGASTSSTITAQTENWD